VPPGRPRPARETLISAGRCLPRASILRRRGIRARHDEAGYPDPSAPVRRERVSDWAALRSDPLLAPLIVRLAARLGAPPQYFVRG